MITSEGLIAQDITQKFFSAAASMNFLRLSPVSML